MDSGAPLEARTGIWLVASAALGHDVPADAGAEYPHVHGRRIPAERTFTGKPVQLDRRGCAACEVRP